MLVCARLTAKPPIEFADISWRVFAPNGALRSGA
jgi:hypothetical protein